jgi:signal transduction histidine kinase/ActR/RegA family two-component response regulator
MEKLRRRLEVSFSMKVLVPVVTIMVLLLGITVWTLNTRITQQTQAEAARSLATVDGVFRKFQDIRRNYLASRYRNLRNEPRYRAVFQGGDLPTLRNTIKDLPDDQNVDIALFTSPAAGSLASAKPNPLKPISPEEFEARSAKSVQRAIQGQENVDTILVGDRLFDVVSIPVTGADGSLIGALTVGSEIGQADVQEFSLLSHSQIVLLADGHVIASTVPNSELQQDFVRLFNECAASPGHRGAPMPVRNITLGDEHYYCAAGRFTTLDVDGKLGYLLLCSYEKPWQALLSTRRMLVLVSVPGILLAIAIIWFLVRKVTQPLRELSESAEAVGRGDFSRRVEVTSHDECGELATVFNQMTENLKRSREQLELTVDTLKTTQAHLIQSEKLSGIGEFVAGVAHELNNPLTSVMGFSELLKHSLADPRYQRQLDMIHKSAMRCTKIVQSLLSFARRHQPERKLCKVNELVETAVEFLQYQLRTSNIEVITSLDSHIPQAMLDPHQVQQVFLNLINNARQAIEAHQPKGWVRISTETASHTIRVRFQDNGPGIPEANLSKVFDPFFTTKEVGKGTGLGLSLCYGIIHEHGGTITVRSRPGEGATFVIEFPVAPAGAEQAAPGDPSEHPMLPAEPPNAAEEGAGKKVLVIDDEEPILEMVRDTLSCQGYQVDIARDGETGLQRLRQTQYDLTLCDWKMPGLNGQQVYERLRATNPALSDRMVFITGDVITHTTQQFLNDRQKVCLAKPFSLADFRAAITKALSSG